MVGRQSLKLAITVQVCDPELYAWIAKWPGNALQRRQRGFKSRSMLLGLITPCPTCG